MRGIVFDLDGTLVDSYGPIAESLNHARSHFDLPPVAADKVRRCVGRGLESLIAELVSPDHVAAGVRKFRERYAEVYADGTFALPEVRETLEHLHGAGYCLAVASNKPARFSGPILERLELGRLFACVVGPDVVAATKPDPRMIHECLARLRLPRGEAVYVGDMALDVESAARAGVPVLLVPGGSSDREALGRTGQPVLETIGTLRDLLPGPAGA